MNKKLETFVQSKIMELIKSGFAVKMHNTYMVEDDECGLSSGFFDGEGKELQVATKRPQREWIPIFVHEYCHFLQWKENAKVWVDSDKVYNACGNLWSWLDGTEEISPSKLERIKKSCQALEQDCDKRAVELIKKHSLPIDIEGYIRSSNAYILFYNICMNERKWYKKSPHGKKCIQDLVGGEFVLRKDWGKLPKGFNKIITQNFL